jgi:rhodanese-related sulfurtransferase
LIAQLSPRELDAWQRDAAREPPFVLDVREPWEYAICRIEPCLHVPMRSLPAAIDELPRERDIVVVCHHGRRSQHVAMWLEHAGFRRIHNLQGGVAAWADDVDPAMQRY